MYIARQQSSQGYVFSIRESYLKDGIYFYRELMDLGRNPRIFIRYPEGRSFFIDSIVDDILRSRGIKADYDELEAMFWPYVKPDVRRRYDLPRSRMNGSMTLPDVSGVHIFDRRRLSFLRTGSMNQRHIDKTPDRMFRTLTCKSRDELEQRFMADEDNLSSKEMKAYVYVIFDLQRHFNAIFAREMPQALDQDLVADHLLDDICTLNRDKPFWNGMDMSPFLHDYLIRYLIMFFDSEYERPRFLEDLEFAGFHSRRYYRQTKRPIDEVYSDAARIFNISVAALKKLNKRGLQKLYRIKARELHPDHGGDHDTFISLSKAYEDLCRHMGSQEPRP